MGLGVWARYQRDLWRSLEKNGHTKSDYLGKRLHRNGFQARKQGKISQMRNKILRFNHINIKTICTTETA